MGTKRALCLLFLGVMLAGSSGCIAAFRVGSPAPELASPGALTAEIGVDVEIHAEGTDVSAEAFDLWKQRVWEGAEQAAAFAAVHRGARPGELAAEVDVYVTQSWTGTFFSLITLFVVPAVQRTDVRMITKVVQPDGSRRAPITEAAAYRVGLGWIFLPIPGDETEVQRDLLLELSRRSLARAAEVERSDSTRARAGTE